MPDFIKNYGSLLLALGMSLGSAWYTKGVIETTLKYHSEQIAKADEKLGKLTDTVSAISTEQARMGVQISYLVQVCGKQERTHVYAPYKDHSQPVADNSR